MLIFSGLAMLGIKRDFILHHKPLHLHPIFYIPPPLLLWFYAQRNGVRNAHEVAQLDVERREKNINHRRTMMMWENSVEQVWNNRTNRKGSKVNSSAAMQ